MRLLRLLTVSLIILLILSIYGCGSSSTGSGTTPTPGTSGSTPPPAVTPTPTPASAPTSTTGPTTGPTTGLTSIPTTGPTITPTVVPTSVPTPGPTPTQSNVLIVDSTLPKLKIESDIPPMQVNQQVVIEVSIYPTGAPMSVSDVRTVENATAVVTGATPVGTPGYTLVHAFGPNESVVATATLETSTSIFSVSPTGPQPKPLNQNKVVWSWFVTPLVAGAQVIGVDIEVQWTSTLSGNQSSPFTLGFPKYRVSVKSVSTSGSVLTQTPITPPDYSAVIAAIITGIFVVIAALIGTPYFRRSLKKRSQKTENKPPTN